MPATYTLIASNTLSSSAASVTFSSIPATYTDLVLRFSARSDLAGQITTTALITVNSNTSNYSYTYLLAQGTSGSQLSGLASAQTAAIGLYATGATATSNTFGSTELYFPSYAGSANKVMSSFGTTENNGTNSSIAVVANLWSNTSAISSITLTAAGSSNFVSGSSFFLYGLKNS